MSLLRLLLQDTCNATFASCMSYVLTRGARQSFNDARSFQTNLFKFYDVKSENVHEDKAISAYKSVK